MAWVRCCGQGSPRPSGWVDITDTFSPQLGNLVGSGVGSYMSSDMNGVKFVRLVIWYASNNATDCSVTMTSPNTTYSSYVSGIGGRKDFEFGNSGIAIPYTSDVNRYVVKKIYVSYDTVMPTPVPTN